MNVKTIFGPSIHAAQLQARRLLGDDMVLSQSLPPNGADLPCVTVLTQLPPARSAAAVCRSSARKAAHKAVAAPPMVQKDYGVIALRKTLDTEENAPLSESFSPVRQAATATMTASSGANGLPRGCTAWPGSGQLFGEVTPMPAMDTEQLDYRRFGLPVQSIQTEAEMHEALQRLYGIDQVLIDAPALPIVALTRVDETPRRGRIAEWLLPLDLPIQFVSDGPPTQDDLDAFSPTWFVKEMTER